MKFLAFILVAVIYSRAQSVTSQPSTQPTQLPIHPTEPTQLPTRPMQPPTQAPTRPRDDPCEQILCMPGYYCVVNTTTGRGVCVVDPCAMLDCQWPQQCRINSTTGRASCITNPCANCLWPKSCIYDNATWTAMCVDNPCNLVDCLPHQYCVVNKTTGMGMCINYSCAVDNGRCQDDQLCEMAVSGCQTRDSHCYNYSHCRDPPYVPCGADTSLACDSEWTYCLQQNKTRRAQCISSCLSHNGNCDEDSVCVTTLEDRLQCISSSDLPSDCPAGQMMSPCGAACQLTCEHQLTGLPLICREICGPPACSCPPGFARFRDRCVDPKLCYVLVNYPPAIKPLPLVDPNTVLLLLHSHTMDQELFTRGQHGLLESIERALSEEGHDVVATIHGVHYDDDQMQVVVELTGGGITSESADALAQALRTNSHLLAIHIEQVENMNVDYIDRAEPEAQGLSQSAIIAFAVSSGVAGVAVIVAWIAVMVCCCVISARRNSRYKDEKYEFNDYSSAPVVEKKDSPSRGHMMMKEAWTIE